MKRVKIYDNFSPIYSDNESNGALVKLNLGHRDVLDTNRYTLVHPSTGYTEIYEDYLPLEDAVSFVYSLYQDSKNLGSSYEDKLILIDEGYAELVVNFEDGRSLNRVIFLVD